MPRSGRRADKSVKRGVQIYLFFTFSSAEFLTGSTSTSPSTRSTSGEKKREIPWGGVSLAVDGSG
jgi:hypothetical protein